MKNLLDIGVGSFSYFSFNTVVSKGAEKSSQGLSTFFNFRSSVETQHAILNIIA